MRVGQIGTTTRMWAEKGTRPIALKQQEFTSAYIFGTVIPESGEFISIITPNVNNDWMIEHLRAVAQQVPENKHLVLLMDRATWHTSKKILLFKNISILPLPTASPELNPAEQIWREFRQRYFGNRCFDSYENICDAACEAIAQFSLQAAKSLCRREWVNLVN